MKKRTVQIKPYTLGDLAKEYGVCRKTLKKWLEPFKEDIGPKTSRFYTIIQVEMIFEKIGTPGFLEEE